MRIYYVFSIKDEFVSLYKETPNALYNILNQMYYMHKDEVGYGFNLFNQITNKIEKDEIDKQIYISLHTQMKYSKKGEEHILNNLYLDDVSILRVKRSHIIINCNRSFTEFFTILNAFDYNFFVCDFNNYDYFFLSNIKLLV